MRILAPIGHFFRGIGRGAAAFWRNLSVITRRRLVAALAIAVALVLLIGVAVPSLPCQFPGGDSCPPPDDAAEIVPADALAYAHLNLESGSERAEDLAAVAEQVPLLAQQILNRAIALAPGAGGEAPDFAADIEPWFGGEAAIAVVPGPSVSADQVLLLEAADVEGAEGYAQAIAAGTPEVEDYRGIEISADQRSVATVVIEDFLVVGSRSGVRAIVDTATAAEGAAPLADDETAESVRDELPDERFLEAWISEQGAADLVAGRGALASLAPLISPGSTRGAAISLSAGEEELELAVRSELDPQREQASPGFFAAFPDFEPQLPERLSAESLAYLGFGEPARTVRALLGQAAAQAPGIATSFEDLVKSLRRDGEIDVEAELLPALGDEAAFAIEPREGLPYLEFVADGVDEEEARKALAGLQGPLADAAGTGSSLQAPVFGEQRVGDVDVRSLTISPNLQIAYAVFDGLAVVATDPAGIEQLAEGEGGLDREENFERATDGFEDEVSLLAYLDLRQLLAEGFEIGLAQVPAFNTFADEFRRLEALGLAVRTEDELLSTDARLLVGEPPEPDEEPSQLPAPTD